MKRVQRIGVQPDVGRGGLVRLQVTGMPVAAAFATHRPSVSAVARDYELQHNASCGNWTILIARGQTRVIRRVIMRLTAHGTPVPESQRYCACAASRAIHTASLLVRQPALLDTLLHRVPSSVRWRCRQHVTERFTKRRSPAVRSHQRRFPCGRLELFKGRHQRRHGQRNRVNRTKHKKEWSPAAERRRRATD